MRDLPPGGSATRYFARPCQKTCGRFFVRAVGFCHDSWRSRTGERHPGNVLWRTMTMRIAYLTIDDVNKDFAMALAARCGATVYAFWPHELPQPGEFDALLYDLDCLPMAQREGLIADLL